MKNNVYPRRIGAVLGLLLLFITAQAQALTLAKTTTQKLTATSDLIVKGQITDIKSEWKDANHDFIYTYLTVEVDEVIKGEAGSTVIVRQMGGQVGEVTQTIPGAPLFEKGEMVLFFLMEFEGAHVIHSIAHGSFRVFSKSDGQYAVNDLGNVHLVDPMTREEVAPGESYKMFQLDAFLNEIRSYLK